MMNDNGINCGKTFVTTEVCMLKIQGQVFSFFDFPFFVHESTCSR